jgi:hypothetical protein
MAVSRLLFWPGKKKKKKEKRIILYFLGLSLYRHTPQAFTTTTPVGCGLVTTTNRRTEAE